MIEKIGRSGVELHQVRKHVNADGEDIGPARKPNNAYLDGKVSSRAGRGPQGCTRMVSHGFGPSKLNVDNDMPKLSKAQRDLLLVIDVGHCTLTNPTLKVAESLVKLGLVIWSKAKSDFVTMADGRRVAELIREGKKK